MKKNLKVAIVHDWFVGGGAEQVVFQIHKLFPNAPIYTSYCSEEWLKKFENTLVVTSYMQKWPFSKLRKFLPILRQRWFSKLDFSSFDLVISSSGAEAKGINTQHIPKKRWTSKLFGIRGVNENHSEGVLNGTSSENNSSQQSSTNKSVSRVASSASKQADTVRKPIHVNYCHSPTHYYWNRYDEYIKNPGFGKLDFLARFGLKIFIDPLRRWDYKAAQKPNYIIANSSYIQKKVKEYYDRDSIVIAPPVDTEFFKSKSSNSSLNTINYVVVGRQTPYKRIDLAVKACTKLSLNLDVVGNGPEHKKLMNIAGPTVTFYKNMSKTEIKELFGKSSGFIFPGLDDFGIAPVEALSAGIPVIAYKDGGALDYVIDGKTGSFFDRQTTESLSKTLESFKPKSYDRKDLIKKASEFSIEKFQENFTNYLNQINT